MILYHIISLILYLPAAVSDTIYLADHKDHLVVSNGVK
jgi:hypothetical protein